MTGPTWTTRWRSACPPRRARPRLPGRCSTGRWRAPRRPLPGRRGPADQRVGDQQSASRPASGRGFRRAQARRPRPGCSGRGGRCGRGIRLRRGRGQARSRWRLRMGSLLRREAGRRLGCRASIGRDACLVRDANGSRVSTRRSRDQTIQQGPKKQGSNQITRSWTAPSTRTAMPTTTATRTARG